MSKFWSKIRYIESKMWPGTAEFLLYNGVFVITRCVISGFSLYRGILTLCSIQMTRVHENITLQRGFRYNGVRYNGVSLFLFVL